MNKYYITWNEDGEVNIYECFSKEEVNQFVHDNNLTDYEVSEMNW